jgi:hypothetical protein
MIQPLKFKPTTPVYLFWNRFSHGQPSAFCNNWLAEGNLIAGFDPVGCA